MAGVFHVEHSGNFCKISEKPKIGRMPEKPKARPTGRAHPCPARNFLLDKKFRRGRASSSTTTIFVKCRLRQYKCKSEICQVFFAGAVKIILNCPGLGSADYTRSRRICQAFFAAICTKIFGEKGLKNP